MTKRAMVRVARVMAMAMAMATVTRWGATKRAMARESRAIATAMRMVGNKEGNGKGSKSNDNGYDDDR